MIVRVSDNIISPLGMSTAENYAAVKAGYSELKRYDGLWGLPEPFVASLMDREKVEKTFAEITDNKTYTFFEKMIPDMNISGMGAQVISASFQLIHKSTTRTPAKVTRLVIVSGIICAYSSSKSLVSLTMRLIRSPVCLSWK